MTTHPTFVSDLAIAAIADGVMDLSLPKPAWTHAAHFAAACWLIRCRPDIEPERDMPGLIRAYNAATGVRNTDTEGYHETITLASLRGARAVLAAFEGAPLHVALNALLAGELGNSGWPLAYWSRERLFSAAARRTWMEPAGPQGPSFLETGRSDQPLAREKAGVQDPCRPPGEGSLTAGYADWSPASARASGCLVQSTSVLARSIRRSLKKPPSPLTVTREGRPASRAALACLQAQARAASWLTARCS